MKVLHVVKTSEGAKWALDLIKQLKLDESIEVYVALPKGGKYYNSYWEVCDGVFEVDFTLNFALLFNGIKLRSIVKKIQPDIIHSWFTQTTLLTRIFLRGLKIPRLFEVVGPLHLENKIFKYFDIYSAGKLDYWIATSEYIRKKYLGSGVSEKKVFLNYAYIDAEQLIEKSNNLEVYDFREKFSLPATTKFIGTASYFYPPKKNGDKGIKGHEYLLDSFEELLKKRDDVCLVVAGSTFGMDESYRESIVSNAKKRFGEKVLFIGHYENVRQIIANLDVFVYLSLSENLGGVYESLLFEVPTISSNRGGLPELVVNDVSGFNLDPNNVSLVAQSIDLLLNDFEKRLMFKKNGKEKVLEIFNGQNILDKNKEIYLRICRP